MDISEASNGSRRLIAGIVVSVGAAVSFIAIMSSHGSPHTLSVHAGESSQAPLQGPGPAVSPAKAFIVPNDQMKDNTPNASQMPQVHKSEKDGPRSQTLAKEIAPALPASFKLTVGSDISGSDASVLVFEAPEGKVVVNIQTLPRPIPLSSVVNMSLTPDVAPIPLPSYEQRQDGSVIVGLSESSGNVVAIAKADGTFVSLESLGNLGAPAPVQLLQLRMIALRHMGLA